MEALQISVTAQITGQVQGVGFRVWARDQALDLGLSGWIKNDPDGSVLAVITGREDAVNLMIEALGKGPPGAVVANVAIERGGPAAPNGGFRILA